MKKTVWTLNIDYAPEITFLTYPLIERYAKKICADFRVISERKFPHLPVVCEKLQIYELGKRNDWNLYVDGDTLIHPDFFDLTEHISKDTVMHNGNDMAGNRWRYDRFFRRDGRNLGACNWFTLGSDWCIELWKPLDDLTLEQALENIHPTANELRTVITKEHLLDDYILSRNIAKYGLKFLTVIDLLRRLGDQGDYLWHQYTLTTEEKIVAMKQILQSWKL